MPTSGRPRRWATPEPAPALARSRSAGEALDERADGISPSNMRSWDSDLHPVALSGGAAPEVVVAADERLPSATGRTAITGLASGTRSTRSTEAQRTCLVTRVPGMASLPSPGRRAPRQPGAAVTPLAHAPGCLHPACARAPRLLRGVVLVRHPPWSGLELFVQRVATAARRRVVVPSSLSFRRASAQRPGNRARGAPGPSIRWVPSLRRAD